MTAEQIQKQSELAAKVMSLTVGKLLLRWHYLSPAVARLALRQLDGEMITDGKSLCYGAQDILERYERSETLPLHDILHALIHNIFRHWNIGKVQPLVWDAACDIATEALICRIAADIMPKENAQKRAEIIRSLSEKVKPLTAEKLYAFLSRQQLSPQVLEEYCELFGVDDHKTWHNASEEREYEPEEQLPTMPVDFNDEQPAEEKSEKGETQDGDEQDSQEQQSQPQPQQQSEDTSGKAKNSVHKWFDELKEADKGELDRQWKQISRQIQSEIEGFGKSDEPAQLALIELLEHTCREKTDYRAFLRRFATAGEVMKADLEAFDVNFYCYGMQLYGDVAFIEPPEYKEVRRVKHFVIALDTSGSVGKNTVRAFVQKTYNILKSEESFFRSVNIYIVQCDTRVQNAALITSIDELEGYMAKLEIKGFGGTDFRPVFEFIDSQRAQGKLCDMKGMIFFTDAMGTFPEEMPSYETAFVIMQGDYETGEQPVLPPWVTRVELQEGDVLDV